MKSILSIIFSFITLISFSQDDFEYDKKTGIVTKNGKSLFKVENVEKGEAKYSVKNSEGKELIYIKRCTFIDKNQISNFNESGEINYYEFIFYNTDSRAEIIYDTRIKRLIKTIYDNKLVVGEDLDSSAEERFIKISGNQYSKRRGETNNNVIIINNNAPEPQQDGIQIKKNGVNISIGN